MSALDTRTFRADNLEQALGDVRNLLGPEAIVLRQREGIVGGIGGFFGKRCVEVDVEVPDTENVRREAEAAMPAARRLERLYGRRHVSTSGGTDRGHSASRPTTTIRATSSGRCSTSRRSSPRLSPKRWTSSPAAAAEPLAPEATPVRASRRCAIEPVAQLSPQPAGQDCRAAATGAELVPTSPSGSMSLTVALTSAGIDLRLAESIVSDADSQLRVFDPAEPFENQVRQALAARIPTRRLGGRFRRRVIALVGAPGSGKTSAAARLCEAHVASGRRVIALSLEPVRRTLELGRRTEALDVELIAADHPGLIDFALARLARAEIVIVDTPGIAPGDEAGWARLAMLLGPIAPHETHLLLPGTLDSAAIDANLGSASEKLQVDRLMLTHLDGSTGPGPAVSAAIRAGIPISATASATKLVPADSYRLAERILP